MGGGLLCGGITSAAEHIAISKTFNVIDASNKR